MTSGSGRSLGLVQSDRRLHQRVVRGVADAADRAGDTGLDERLGAKRSQLAPFVTLARTIEHHKPLILNTLAHGLSNARSEAANVHLRTLTSRAYGFHSPEALIAMAMLTRGGCCPPLPGRTA